MNDDSKPPPALSTDRRPPSLDSAAAPQAAELVASEPHSSRAERTLEAGAPRTAPASAEAADIEGKGGVDVEAESALDADVDSDAVELLAIRAHTSIYAEPSARSREVGYLRSGALVSQRGTSRAGADCAAGFLPIEPKGFVCAADVSTDPEHVLRGALSRRPDRSAGLPYIYGRPRSFGPMLYNRLPSPAEQREREPEGRGQLLAAWSGLLQPDVPDFLAEGRTSLRLDGRPRSDLVLANGRAISDSAFAFLSLFESDGRAFGLTTELSLVPLERLELVVPSTFSGVPLGDAIALPLVFVRSKTATLFRGSPERGLQVARPLSFREAVGLSGKQLDVAGRRYLETRDGHWLLDGPLLTRVDAVGGTPPGRSQSTWLDVSIRNQTLVAYEGEVPVYATLVSTGAEGLLDAETHRATVQGDFLIHTKHVTSTMDSDVEGDAYDLRDVPYVQYFSGGTALHAAFWHDAFGTPRSHGCINLSPLDARWLFDWSEPRVPRPWHGAMSLLGGTLVRVHP